jgi:arsenite oxidase small subunit
MRELKAMQNEEEKRPTCVTRRDFLLFGGGAATTILLVSLPGCKPTTDKRATLRLAAYPRKRLGKLSRLRPGEPVEFHYPYEHPHCTSFVVKLGGVAAGGGVGPERDIVAFNALCAHQGGLLSGMVDGTYRIAGPCPIHLSTFDLTRHGIVVAGHATQSLPQVVLAVEGDILYATGVMGLIYGFASNLPGDGKGRV